MAEAPVPVDLSSNLAKAGTLPDVLKKSTIDWNRVKKVDGAFDTVPTIKARGAELTLDKDNFPNADKMRKGTEISVGDSKTNLVDHVLQDEQLRVILQEGMRLNVLNEADFKGMGLEPKNFQKGEVAGLQIPGLNRLQKSEAISLILHRLGESNSRTTSQFLDEASKLILNPKDVTLLNKVGGTLSNQSLINALAAGGREELNKYIVEQGYQPFAMEDEQPLRRVMAKLVNEDYGDEGVTRVMKETTPFFADRKDVKLEDGTMVEKVGVPEYSALIDMRVAQAMTNAMMPPEFHLTIARIESQIASTKDVAQAEDLRDAITRTKRNAYAALMNVYGVDGFQKDGTAYKSLEIGVDDQNEIMSMTQKIKESARFKETQDMTMFEANRASLAQITAEVTGLDPVKLQQITMAFPIEMTVESLREEARKNLLSEDVVEVDVKNKLSNSFILFVNEGFQKKNTGLRPIEESLLKKFFLKTYDTERSMLSGKGSLRNFKDADAPTKVKIGSPEAVNMGAKGLRLLFDRTVTEQRYDFETYKAMLIKGAAEVSVEKAGTVLEQGLDKKAVDNVAIRDEANAMNEAFDKRSATDEALAENKRRDEVDDAIAEDKARDEAIKVEEEAQRSKEAEADARRQELQNIQELHEAEAAYNSRTIEQSLNYAAGGGDELSVKIQNGDVTSADINQAMDSLLGLPHSMRHFARARRWMAERALVTNKDKKETYQRLAEHRQEALDAEEEKRKRNQEQAVNQLGEVPTVPTVKINPVQDENNEEEIDLDSLFLDLDEKSVGTAEQPPLADDADIPPFLKNRK